MKTSIQYRNFYATAAIVLLSFTILGALFTAWSYRLVMSDRRETMAVSLDAAAEFVSAQCMDYGFDLSGLYMRMTVSAISRISGYDILLADTAGTIVNCSDKELNCTHTGKIIPEPELAKCLRQGEYSGVTTLGRVFSPRRYAAGKPLTFMTSSGRVTFGYVFVSSDSSAMIIVWRQFAGVFILIALIVMLLTFMISLITSKKMAAPINEMAQAARRFARGDFSVRVSSLEREDEIGELSAAFNAMADSLESAESRRREFIANISHELKTPMTVIAGFADGILDGTIPKENEARYLSIISSETMRLSRLVKSMTDLSKIQSSDTGRFMTGQFDISEVIRLALVSLGGKIDQRGIKIEPELPDDPVITRGDSDSITQVVYNLTDNAIKFSQPGAAVKISLWKQSGKAYVSVENTGETIPQDEMPLIFGRFHKADKSRSADREGVGLGLYIVKTILDSHSEDIYVTSENGVTQFVFTLTIV